MNEKIEKSLASYSAASPLSPPPPFIRDALKRPSLLSYNNNNISIYKRDVKGRLSGWDRERAASWIQSYPLERQLPETPHPLAPFPILLYTVLLCSVTERETTNNRKSSSREENILISWEQAAAKSDDDHGARILLYYTAKLRDF